MPLCATPELTDAQRKSLSREASFALRTKQAAGLAPTSITYVPIRPHIFRKSNGSGGMSLRKMNNILAITNSYYLNNDVGVQFYFCGTSPDYIDNDNLYNAYPAYEEAPVNGRDATNAMNQYYVHSFDRTNLGGYAFFPDEDAIGTTRSFILDEDDESDLANRLIPHELGHNFGLFHTFGNTGIGTNELVTRGAGANCTEAGDELCDTPADPYGMPGASVLEVNGCEVYNGTAVDAQGNRFVPSSTNLMSYYFPCTHDFTPGQYDRVQAGLALRQTHSTYSLDCPPTNVLAATNLTVRISDFSVVLTWQDNAANEMGYFIERSTSPSSGFVPVGGVGQNETSFIDTKIAGTTLYYYRVRPSNATTNGISSTVSIVSPAGCRPNFDKDCAEGDGLDGFIFNGTVLSQDSNCSPSGFSSFTATSATVLAGQSYTFRGTLLSTSFQEGVSIWADLNRNGLFETSQNELLFQTPTPVRGQFTGTLTIPSGLASGLIGLRIIAVYDTVPGDPCGRYEYGEAEDYRLHVIPPPSADLSLSMQVSNRTPLINQPVSYSLTLTNRGPSAANNVSWQNYLPPNLAFVTGDSRIVTSGTAISSSNITLANGASSTFVYQLRPTQPGTYISAAQIMSSNLPDPDSQLGSGTGDGQDDAASVDIRTASASDAIYISPNTNQVPLPPVSPNQPTPDPAKADLSLSMALSDRTPGLSQPVTFTLTVRNAGGIAAGNIIVRDTLRGLTLQTPSSNITVVGTGSNYTIIEGTIPSLAAGQSGQLIFTARPLVSGFVKNNAQIWSSTTADPDSRPGVATPTGNNLNGEDDVAEIDLRVGS